MNKGYITQIIGPVVDIQFPDGKLPAIYSACVVKREGDVDLILEVQQHLGENVVRAVSMDSTDGLVRGA
ncbi:MAG TPA: F0F1 ATP synthase subunit beta, partial [Calditrichia bacterium]|nr:F0F1 ATP synthase subunit beta [Calditrichia bacterium]